MDFPRICLAIGHINVSRRPLLKIDSFTYFIFAFGFTFSGGDGDFSKNVPKKAPLHPPPPNPSALFVC